MNAQGGLSRDQFPVLERCVYLNSNSTGAFPRSMRTTLDQYAATLEGWRDEVWESWWESLHAYADSVATFLGGPRGSVVTDVSLSSLLGRIGTCFDWRGPRNRVVTTDLEFPTVPFVWRAFARLGAEVVVVPSRDGVRIDEEDLVAAIDERTQLVCVSHASFATGALLDVAPIAERAQAVGALVALDAYQSIGCVPVDVRALDVDFVLGGAHKWLCGALDLGFLYVRPERLPELEPAASGWMAGEAPLTFEPQKRYAATARRFASGTPAVLPTLLSQDGLDIVSGIGMDVIRAHSLRRTARIMDAADALDLEVATPRDDEARGGIVCLRGFDAARAVTQLRLKTIVVSHRRGMRVAPHFYNTDDEVELFIEALGEVVGELRR